MTKWFENIRIKNKLILSFSLLLFIIMVFMYSYFPAKMKITAYKEKNQRVISLARSLALGYGIVFTQGNYRALSEIAKVVTNDSNFAYCFVFDKEGELYDTYPEDVKTTINKRLVFDQPVKRGDIIEVKVPISYYEKDLGSIILGTDLKDVEAAVSRINYTGTLVLLLVFFLGIAIVLFIASLINRPIQSLMDSVNHIIHHGDYSERVRRLDESSGDEAGMLAHRFNEMIEMIEERDVELKQQYEELQTVNHLKDEFLAATTHDLRSPITAILGFTDLILLDDELSQEGILRMGHIRQSTEFLASLVNDVLDISQLEADKTQLKMTPTALAKIIESSIDTLHYMALPKDISISFSNKVEPNMVKGDYEALLRIMNNLLSNAIKFTNRGGRVEVNLLPVSKDNDGRSGLLAVEVKDTGIGIPEEKIPQLFQTYTPVSRPGTAGEKGTGLGLSITKNLLEKHNGSIEVNSKEGEGSCFTITLPAGGDE
ncbi:MAG: HAMP domain-containing histidine kinase [bacterium]|nr:HAMP domain-containing histidine kinase [bacterium]